MVVEFGRLDLADQDGAKMETISEDGCTFLGVSILKAERKVECIRRLKNVLKFKLSGKNAVLAVNTWEVSIMHRRAK